MPGHVPLGRTEWFEQTLDACARGFAGLDVDELVSVRNEHDQTFGAEGQTLVMSVTVSCKSRVS